MYNTLGAIGRTAADIEDFMSATLGADEACKPKSDPRFVPLPWRSGIAKKNSPLKIGWYDVAHAYVTIVISSFLHWHS